MGISLYNLTLLSSKQLVEHLRRKHSHWPVPLGKHVVGQEVRGECRGRIINSYELVFRQPPAFAEPEATPVAATEGMKQTGTAAESGAAAASEETGASAEEPAPAAKEEETIAQPQAAHQAEEKELVPVAVPSETAPPAESTAATDIKPAVPVPATTSQPQDSISVDPTTDLPQGGVAGKRQIFAAATSAHVPTDQEIADLKPELPYPDFDP